MATVRRMGPETAVSRIALMDAVESVMREQGYGALSARSVAAQAGLKHQLVYYYFKTMDELLLATYRRRTARMMDRVKHALATGRPLHALWETYSDPDDSALTVEYMALSNHNELIRAETVAFGEHLRQTGLEHLGLVTQAAGGLGAAALSPLALTTAIRSVASVIGMESALGISGGHRETRALLEWCIDRLEPPSA